MPINVFGNTSGNTQKNDTSLFVQKLYLRAKNLKAISKKTKT